MKNVFISTVGGMLIVVTLFMCGGILESALQMERTGMVFTGAALGPLLLIENFLPPESSDNSDLVPYHHEIRIAGLLIGICCSMLVYALPIYIVLRWNERSVSVKSEAYSKHAQAQGDVYS